MQEERSGSENQEPRFVGPWSPLDDDASPGGGARGAWPGSSDAEQGQPGDTAPLTGSRPAPDQPPRYGQPGAYGQSQPGGYGQAGGYGQPAGGHTQPESYGQPGAYGQAASHGQSQPGGGYGQPGGYGGPPGGYRPPADYMEQQPRRRRARGFAVYLAVAALAAGIGAGAVAALDHSSSVSQNSPGAGSGPNPGGNPGNVNPGSGFAPRNGSGSNPGSGASTPLEQAVASAVEPGVVDISSNLQYQGGTAEATGMVISRSGLVLTNNHVIDETTGLTATLVSTGQRFRARWLGYDRGADVAVIQLEGASGLSTVPLGDSSTVQVGDQVVAIGNAQGVGGKPTVVSGSITNLNQTITASDDLGGSETLHGMLQTNANIVEGDSGGPLASASGKVIGMDTAASSGSFGNQSAEVGFAIPINTALGVAHQIIAGKASSSVTVGATGFLGVLVPSSQASAASSPTQQQQLQETIQGGAGFGGGTQGCLSDDQNAGVPQTIAPVAAGTLILGELCDTPAASAGMSAGDVITGVDGSAVGSPNSLTAILSGFRPGSTVSVTWVDTAGQRHVSSLSLLAHPPT